VAAGHSVGVDPARWQAGLEELLGRVAGRFPRVEPRRRTRALVLGLLADLPRKNCWTIAEHAGDATPDGMQHLLARAVWDHDGVRDDLRAYVVEHLGDPQAVLVVDETGDLKKGTATVGVQRQYTGTAGRIENAQVAVYLAYATDAGHALIDRELYVPQGWTCDPERCRDAGIPAQVGFATKPALATKMVTRALAAGVPAAWVAGDEVYGADPGLRAELEARGVGYVLAVACDHPVRVGGAVQRADALLRQVPARAWQQISCGKGAKGHRLYQWAFVRLGTRQASAGCWSAATNGPASWPSTAATRPAPPRWPSWSRSPAAAGPSRSASRPARACVAWTSTRPAAGAPGTAGPPWRCSPTPSWWWRPSANTPATHHRWG
jgi:SRSO17 transposase